MTEPDKSIGDPQLRKSDISESEMAEIIRNHPRIRFEDPTRMVEIPIFDSQVMSQLVPGEWSQTASQIVQKVYGYLGNPVIADDFLSHHDRTEWANQMTEKYGSVFHSVYSKNKLRLQGISSMISNMEILALVIQQSGQDLQSKQLNQIVHRIKARIIGEPSQREIPVQTNNSYDQLDYSQKLAVIRENENDIVAALNLLFPDSPKELTPLT